MIQEEIDTADLTPSLLDADEEDEIAELETTQDCTPSPVTSKYRPLTGPEFDAPEIKMPSFKWLGPGIPVAQVPKPLSPPQANARPPCPPVTQFRHKHGHAQLTRALIPVGPRFRQLARPQVQSWLRNIRPRMPMAPRPCPASQTSISRPAFIPTSIPKIPNT